MAAEERRHFNCCQCASNRPLLPPAAGSDVPPTHERTSTHASHVQCAAAGGCVHPAHAPGHLLRRLVCRGRGGWAGSGRVRVWVARTCPGGAGRLSYALLQLSSCCSDQLNPAPLLRRSPSPSSSPSWTSGRRAPLLLRRTSRPLRRRWQTREWHGLAAPCMGEHHYAKYAGCPGKGNTNPLPCACLPAALPHVSVHPPCLPCAPNSHTLAGAATCRPAS